MTSHDPRPPAREEEERRDFLKAPDTFVAKVIAVCADPGKQQALRRAAGKPVEEVPARAHAALLRTGLIPDSATGYARKWAHYCVAGLIASRPRAERLAETEGTDRAADEASPDAGQDDPATPARPRTASFRPDGTSLGESMAVAVTRRGEEGLKEEGIESRLHLMVRQELDGIHRMLPGVTRQLGARGVPVDYACLLHDLSTWPYHRDRVATRWLEDYYRTLRRAEAAKNKPSAPDGTGTDSAPTPA